MHKLKETMETELYKLAKQFEEKPSEKLNYNIYILMKNLWYLDKLKQEKALMIEDSESEKSLWC